MFKLFFKFERLEIVIRRMIENEKLIDEVTITFDVNRKIQLNRIQQKNFVVNEHDKKCRFLNKIKKINSFEIY